MSLTPKGDMFLKSLKQTRKNCRNSLKLGNSRKRRVIRKVGISKKIRKSRVNKENS